MTNSWARLTGFTHIKEKSTDSSLRGGMPSEYIKKINQETRASTPAETNESKDMMDQDNLEEYFRG